MLETRRRALLVVAAISVIAAPCHAQVRGLDGAGGSIGAAGAVVTIPVIPNLNTNLSLPPTLSAPVIMAPAPSAAAAPAIPAEPTTAAPPIGPAPAEVPAEATMTTLAPDPVPTPPEPLLWARGWTADQASRCDMSDAARQTCSGPDCLLSCSADVCPGQQSANCEFAIDCSAEITAELVSGDQQCDEQSVERTEDSSDRGVITVSVIRLAAGESCRPPPCVN